jgi:hypothetical protein
VDERPVWRQLFDAWEKEFGPRLEEYVQSDEFAERMTAFQQMNRRRSEIAEEATRQFLRFWNLPTASDLDKVNQQLADIDRRLRALNRPVEQEAPAPGPRKRQGAKTAAGMKAAVESREAAAKRGEAATGEATLETHEPPSAAEAAVADTSTASDPTAVSNAATGDSSGVPSSTAEVTPANTAGSAEGVTAKASASKAKASKAKASKAKASKPKASTGKVSKARSAKASESPKSSAPTQKASQKAESHSPRSGYRDRRRSTERDAGNNPKGKA